MRNCIRVGVWLWALLVFALQSVSAHEYWLDPLAYRIDAGDRLGVHIRVGQHFNGDTQPYLPQNTERFYIQLAGASIPVTSRIGDIPALDQTVNGEGLAVVVHVSNDYTLTYREEGLFESFLQYEGLLPKLAEHRRRGLPMTGFRERYQRFTKTLVQVGEGSGKDRQVGLVFEWVLESNPYLSQGDALSARLYWQGKPLAGVQTRLFIGRGRSVEERVLMTDAEGRVEFTPPEGSRLMLNAVQLHEPSQNGSGLQEVAWKSFWASISFAVP